MVIKIRIGLVSVPNMEGDPPLGLAYIASYVRKYSDGNDAIIIDKENPIKAVRKHKPDIVGISSLTHEFPEANRLAKTIREEFNLPVIVGGQHIALLPSHFSPSNFDMAVIGEGEQTVLELVNTFNRFGSFPKKQLRQVSGLMFRTNGHTITTEPRKMIEPIDKIPFPARDLLKMKEYYLTPRIAVFGKFGIYATILTSRGCPYNCAFCSPQLFWQTTRFHSPEYVVSEIKQIVEEYKPDNIMIKDDLFISNRKRLQEIAKLIKQEEMDVGFHANCRANLIDREMCKLLKDMNIKSVEFGLESGSDKILGYLKHNTVTVADNRRALRLCKEFGFGTVASFIIGSPRETEEDLQKTLDLVNDKNLDKVIICQLTPYPGTEVWEYAKQKGVVSDDLDFDWGILKVLQYKPCIVLTDEMDAERFKEWFYRFKELASKKHGKITIRKLLSFKREHIRLFLSRRFVTKVFKYLFYKKLELS